MGVNALFQLTSYLASEFPPEVIMLDDVIPNPDMDPVIVIPDSLVILFGFGSDAFSVDQLFETFCPLIAPSHIGSSCFVDGVSIDVPCASRKYGRPSFILFEEELDEACRLIARVENIISTMLERDLKFFDGLLTLRDQLLVVKFNLRVAKGMKLVGEEMLLKVREIYANLSIRYYDIVAKVVMPENQKSLVEAYYAACLQEKDVSSCL
ncbi:unnamed protein product [Lactuca virosa]|uniref:Uncharacterized protein n=1 Tax=Lactuca virosa TaxID=75947 RepID=A0AAU9PT59_9ASTR|nr:unnamed protein product [Lactuca virosa]